MTHPQYQDELLSQHLHHILGHVDPAAMGMLQQHLEWVEIAAGETLMQQGDAGNSMYLTISGRLRAYVVDEDGVEHMVREMSRGQIIGEMSLYTDEPRSATVVAIRDSVLVRLARSDFHDLLASNTQVSIALTRQIIRRLQTAQSRNKPERPITIALLPITEGLDLAPFIRRLADKLAAIGRVRVVDAASIDRDLNQPGLAQSETEDVAAKRRITMHLDEIEAAHDYVLLLCDDGPTAWTRRCSRCSDEVLLVADATRPAALHPSERQCLMNRTGRTEAAETLVLLHPADLRCPTGTRKWLDRRPLAGHVHIRPELDRDMGRLARILSGTAIGLVLSGGGARGCAHMGIYRALLEHEVEIDFVGGTSIGAVMATLIASDRSYDDALRIARRAFSVDPTGDFSTMPLISLISGRRLRRLVETAINELVGRQVDVEDLWKNYFCVASNYSRATEHVFRRGGLFKAIMASIAIPGALPPVLHEGDLLCDGGTFNNFPADVMRRLPGVGKVIGADLGVRKRRPLDLAEVPSGWALLRDRLRPRSKRRYKLPSLVAYLMNVTILYSTSRQRESQKLTDLYFNPPLERVGMLQWDRFNAIVDQGYAHGLDVLGRLDHEQKKAFAPS